MTTSGVCSCKPGVIIQLLISAMSIDSICQIDVRCARTHVDMVAEHSSL